MMFSKQIERQTLSKFDRLLCKAGEQKKAEILSRLDEVEREGDEDLIFAIKWLYAFSPLSDMANYDFSLFRATAQHGVFLRRSSLFAKDIPESIFLNYVLHTRMGGEEICDCRKFFYDTLNQKITGMTMSQAVIELNYWNAENVTYRNTDFRTMSALATYNSTFGRCGEESVFAVNVFRSLGIPARQVYTPRWAHCDDNHAWVEVWCDGKWHFLGACEPEEVLNKGWFNNASARAMLLQCRSFGVFTDEEIIPCEGEVCHIVNNLDTYATTKKITFSVVDEKGKPVSGAGVMVGILNYSHVFSPFTLYTDDNGKASLTCGLGSLNVRVKKGDVATERMIYTPDSDVFEFVLQPQKINYDVWEEFVAIAPEDGLGKGNRPTAEQKEACRVKTAAAAAKREERAKSMFDQSKAEWIKEKYGYSQKILDVLKNSYGNFENILSFLQNDTFTAEEKEGLLLTLTDKDYRDLKPEILVEALECAKEYVAEKDIFYKYVACPRVWFETLSLNRRFIQNYFRVQKDELRLNPPKIWEYINKNIGSDTVFEYGSLITNPVGALTVKNANYVSKKILFVSICRALGVAARLNPVNMLAEFYKDGRFESVESLEKGESYIILEKGDGEDWQYWTEFGVGLLSGDGYENLEIDDSEWKDNRLTVSVKSGEYRILTDNRLPNGNLFSAKYHFTLGAGETKTVKLHRHEADMSQMLYSYKVDEFKAVDSQGNEVLGSELTAGHAVLMWLQPGEEPTEHILNEMLEHQSEFKALKASVAFMLKNKDALSNAKLSKVLDTFSSIKVYFDGFTSNSEILSRRLFLDPDKKPLIVITKQPLTAVYAYSGYNVGSGTMILRICDYLDKNQ